MEKKFTQNNANKLVTANNLQPTFIIALHLEMSMKSMLGLAASSSCKHKDIMINRQSSINYTDEAVPVNFPEMCKISLQHITCVLSLNVFITHL